MKNVFTNSYTPECGFNCRLAVNNNKMVGKVRRKMRTLSYYKGAVIQLRSARRQTKIAEHQLELSKAIQFALWRIKQIEAKVLN